MSDDEIMDRIRAFMAELDVIIYANQDGCVQVHRNNGEHVGEL